MEKQKCRDVDLLCQSPLVRTNQVRAKMPAVWLQSCITAIYAQHSNLDPALTLLMGISSICCFWRSWRSWVPMDEAAGGLSPYPVTHSVLSPPVLTPPKSDQVQHGNVIDSLASEEKIVTSTLEQQAVWPPWLHRSAVLVPGAWLSRECKAQGLLRATRHDSHSNADNCGHPSVTSILSTLGTVRGRELPHRT